MLANLRTPIALEMSLKRFESKAVDWCANHFNSVVTAFLGAAFGLILIFSQTAFDFPSHYPANGGLFVIENIRFGIGVVVFASSFTLFLKTKLRLLYLALITLAAWIYSVNNLFADLGNGPLLNAIYISLPAYLGLAVWVTRTSSVRNRNFYPFLLFLVLFMTMQSLISIGLYQVDQRLMQKFWSFRFGSIVIVTFLAAFFYRHQGDFYKNFLNPANALRGFLWPESSTIDDGDRSQRLRLWWKGALNILVGYSALELRILFDLKVRSQFHGAFLLQTSEYILAILAIIAFLNVLCGAARLYGFRLIDATNFVWLSRSPAEYWRRGVVYNYLFISRYIFIPLRRWLKIQWLSVLIAFSYFVFDKIGFVTYLAFFDKLLGLELIKTDVNFSRAAHALVHSVLWFGMIMLSPHLFHRTQFTERPLPAWLSVLATHAIMASLYYMAYVMIRLSGYLN